MRDEQCSVVAKGVYAYAHTFWDNDDDDDEDGERESKEERRNRMNGKGEGEGRGDETASALMRSGDMRTRRPAKKRIVMHQRIALLTFPAQPNCHHTRAHHTACRQCHAE